MSAWSFWPRHETLNSADTSSASRHKLNLHSHCAPSCYKSYRTVFLCLYLCMQIKWRQFRKRRTTPMQEQDAEKKRLQRMKRERRFWKVIIILCDADSRQSSSHHCTSAHETHRKLQVSKMCIAVRKVATPLRKLTCHMGSHSVTCHPAEVTFPPLPQPKLVLDLATPE